MLTSAMAPETRHREVQEDPTGTLIDRAQAGDRVALEELFARQVPRLRRWASGRMPRWARDIADTTDLIHDTVLDTLKHLNHFEHRGDGALQAYLRQAIVNRIRNELRKRAARGAPERVDTGFSDGGTSPLEKAIANQTLERYEAALGTLTPDERDAVISRLELGLSYAQIADALGRPTANAARMTVVRALARVADRMRANGFDTNGRKP
jgi:RNA polymerase sigma-70 factor (ECF subfamily)